MSSMSLSIYCRIFSWLKTWYLNFRNTFLKLRYLIFDHEKVWQNVDKESEEILYKTSRTLNNLLGFPFSGILFSVKCFPYISFFNLFVLWFWIIMVFSFYSRVISSTFDWILNLACSMESKTYFNERHSKVKSNWIICNLILWKF